MLHNIEKIIALVKTKIPDQGPLEYFVHHNTLHHYEHLNFFEAVKKAAGLYNTQAFMPMEYYIKKYEKRRIAKADIQLIIKQFIHKHELNIPYYLVKKLLLEFEQYDRNNHLYQDKIKAVQDKYFEEKKYYYQQAIKDEFGIDSDFPVLAILYRFLPNYFDFGSAYWKMQRRHKGMWDCFCYLHESARLFDIQYRKSLSRIIKQYRHSKPIMIIKSILSRLQLAQEEVEGYLFELCYKHKGWAGFIKSLEMHPDWNNISEIQPNFIEFTLICLVCEYASIQKYLPKIQQKVPITKRLPKHSSTFLNTYFIMLNQNKSLQYNLEDALPVLTHLNCQEILHKAYEKSFYTKLLSAYDQPKIDKAESTLANYQVITCIDDRLESLRRYLEIDKNCDTFSCAGHFGLNIAYKGFFDKHYRNLCPVNASAGYYITEKVNDENSLTLRLIAIYGQSQWMANNGSKTFLRGYFLPFIGGVFNIIPFALDVINPKILNSIKRKISHYFHQSTKSYLCYKAEKLSNSKSDKAIGMPFDDRLEKAISLLSSIGLTHSFSKYIVIMGHGSSSLNNPHKAAYDCGACGGSQGFANARLMANILNESLIRQKLAKNHNILIPDSTQFIGAFHNTCNNDVRYFDINYPVAASLANVFDKIKSALLVDAKEKCRRFSMTPLNNSFDYYKKHIQARSHDYREPRPEYGHSTNAICIIGPRNKTRSLFLDRRAFLVSYDPSQDKNGDILINLVNTAILVCAGINLEYYFSFIDNEKYGCGTKLPHNITGLVGVMNGHLSDLQLGLPWQMVEIHEPVRLFVLIIADINLVKEILVYENVFSRLTKNEWITLAVDDIHTNTRYTYENGQFVSFENKGCSVKYFEVDERVFNTKSHLPFGEIVV
jgi:hypothetical protein